MIKGKFFEFKPMKPTQKGVSTNIYYKAFLEDVEVGYILLENYDFKLGRAEIAYKIHKPLRKKGVATLMVKDFIEVIPEYFCLTFFDAKVRADNIASCRVLEKAGFTEKPSTPASLFEEKTESQRKYYFLDIEEDLAESISDENIRLIDVAMENIKENWG